MCRRLERCESSSTFKTLSRCAEREKGACIMSISSCPCQSPLCIHCVYKSILRVLVFGSSLLAASPVPLVELLETLGQVSKHSSRKAQRAEAQVRSACHTNSHLRHHSRPALLSAPSSLHVFTSASHQELIIFLLTLTSRSTQEPLFAFGLVCLFAYYYQRKCYFSAGWLALSVATSYRNSIITNNGCGRWRQPVSLDV
jgi:hypothetical protein